MTITLKSDHSDNYVATDLGYLLHKNPGAVFEKELSFGVANIFYSAADAATCTACLYVHIDPIDLVRSFQSQSGHRNLKQYINDRPYATNSFLSVAISRVFGTALGGTCNKQPELVAQSLPLSVNFPVLSSRGGEKLLERLFSPLGYDIEIESNAYDAETPEWGDSPYFKVSLSTKDTLTNVLKHLYVLIPVLDNDKHYWVSGDEVDKLLRHGGDWVASHPMKELIVKRYLKRQGSLTKRALKQLALTQEPEVDVDEPLEDKEKMAQQVEDGLERKIRLNDLRINKVKETIKDKNCHTVIDLGCGEGRYIKEYLKMPELNQVVGLEVSPAELAKAEQRLRVERLPERIRDKLSLIQGSLTYNDRRTQGFDMATCIEVIEHIDEERLDAFKQALFGFASPRFVILTTPNIEYNQLFEGLKSGQLRHADHRFEWDRETFQAWCNAAGDKFQYIVSFDSVGEIDEKLGAPTQMAVFEKVDSKN